MLKYLASGLAAILFSSSLALADDAAGSPAKALDPDAVKAAHELMNTMNVDVQMKTMIEALITAQETAIKEQHPDVSQPALDMFADAFRQEFAASQSRIDDMYVDVYAEHFTGDELRTVNAFYQSDTGKKFVTEMPQLMREIQPLAITFGLDLGKRVRARVNAELQKQGQGQSL